ncbi:protein FAM228B isoform X2 [Pogona vitticeps]|uniref:Protein FAM228B-like isoform X2 n=1 Tax=Pogona vitticeps TaxID=103695 RepID=A0ABM5EI71_9SAUR
MEVGGPEDSLSTTQLGPLTSTPRESAPPLPPTDLPSQTDSSTSISSESSGEDWLIKICCPGARHRYCRHAKKKKTPTGVLRQESSDLQWLIRLRCPRTQMEQIPHLKQCLPAASSSLSRSPSKTCQSSPSERAKTSESWLTPKHFSVVQAIVNESQDICSTLSLLERENCFVREVDKYLKYHDFLALRKREMQYKKWFENVSRPLLQKIQDKIDSQSSEEVEERKRKQLSLYLDYCNKKGNAFLESYTPSVYDPFFLKTCTDIWKASIPPLNDPLLKEIQERYFEAGIIKQCDTGKIYSSKEINELQKVELPLLPLSRQLMNPVEWLKIPPGYMESEIRQKSRQKMVPTRNMSSMDFKSWNDSSLLQPNKRCTSARKQDFVCLPSFLKKTRTGSSVCKPAIKFAS